MNTEKKSIQLCAKSIQVLKLIAEGKSYAQIIDGNRDLSYRDIFLAAAEALSVDEQLGAILQGNGSSIEECAMARAKRKYPRAYEQWSQMEDSELARMIAEGMTRGQIAVELQRQPSAISSRLRKKGLQD